MTTEATIEDLLSLFEDVLSPDQMLYAKATSQISSAITRERLRLRMNQSEFADYIHATQSLVSRWESGEYNFTLQKIAEIAAALDMDVSVRMHKPYDIQISSDKSYSAVRSHNDLAFTNPLQFHPKNNFNAITYANSSERSNYYVSICK